MATSPLADPEERRVWHAAFDSFRQYRQYNHHNTTHIRRQSFYSLPAAHIDLLSAAPFNIPRTFQAIDAAIDQNADFAEAILDFSAPMLGLDQNDSSWHGEATNNDHVKARSTIKQFFRDWTADGAGEREACYDPILSALTRLLPPVPQRQRWAQRVLVPGAGLGRLVFEICVLGYTVSGNEISYHQIIASNFIMNYSKEPGRYRLYPWATSFNNLPSRANQLQSSSFPDIVPGQELTTRPSSYDSDKPPSDRLSMTSGDFCVLYNEPQYQGGFSAVTTCFFIDTAPNVIKYIETIRHCLESGGLWINLGPLLWHFEAAPPPEKDEDTQEDEKHDSSQRPHLDQGIGEPGAFELSSEELLLLIKQMGFEILEAKPAPGGQTGYIQDPSSMLQSTYYPIFWVAKKI